MTAHSKTKTNSQIKETKEMNLTFWTFVILFLQIDKNINIKK